MTVEALPSKTIRFLRFPLIVGVVLIHSHFTKVVLNGVDLMKDGNFPVYTTTSYFLSEIISRIAVPLFFLISGFLFFNRTASFTGQTYRQKLRKRARTILVPYLFWNLLVILFYFLSQTFLPEIISGKNKLICDYTVSDWFWAFWDAKKINPTTLGPIYGPFWFIRDLMVVMLFSPFVHFLLKNLRQYAVMCFGMLWIFDCWFNVAGFSIEAFFFFSAGAYFSIRGKNFIEVMKPFLPVVAVFYSVMTVFELYRIGEVWYDYIHRINIIAGVVLAITLSAHFIEKERWSANPFLSDSSFFIYAYHGMFLTLVMKILFKMIQPHSDGIILALYIVCPATVIFIGLFLYRILRKYLPRTTALITGGR